jgi:prepilin-type N-terminal cleavage/methylation domain-containing protein
MITNERKGFTLIEILIVVAIIAILASIVLVGLGPSQQSGRDARRLSDLREVQNGLELFYNKCGYYPGTVGGAAGACAVGAPGGAETWTSLQTALTGAGIGINAGGIPQDPSNNQTYGYDWGANNTSYILGAVLENTNNSVFNNYTPPTITGGTWAKNTGNGPNAACTGPGTGGTGGTFCITL